MTAIDLSKQQALDAEFIPYTRGYSLEDAGLMIQGVSETIENNANEQKGRFLNMLLGTLGASLLGNLLTDIEVMTGGEETIGASQDI